MITTPQSKSAKKSASENARPSNHETLLMTLAMLDMIPKVGKISASEIHARLLEMGFERDLRSIQRQLEVLSSHFSIERDDCSKPYGYKWGRDAKGISIPGLTLDESLLLNIAEKYLRNLMPYSLKQAMDGFFNQARFNLGNVPDEKLERRWLSKVRVVSTGVELLAPQIQAGVLETISQALFHETWLELEYVNQDSERKNHRVRPLGLAQQGSRLVLVVRFEGYENERNLAVSRINKATDTHLPFPAVKGFDLEAYEKSGGFGYSHGKTIQLKFRIDKKLGMFLTESRLSKDQTVNHLDTQLEISATVVESEHLVWWLRGFGRQVEVLAPKTLIIQIAS